MFFVQLNNLTMNFLQLSRGFVRCSTALGQQVAAGVSRFLCNSTQLNEIVFKAHCMDLVIFRFNSQYVRSPMFNGKLIFKKHLSFSPVSLGVTWCLVWKLKAIRR